MFKFVMAIFVTKVRVVVITSFAAENIEHAKKNVSQKVWDVFDEIEATNDVIEIDDIEEILSVEEELIRTVSLPKGSNQVN